MHIHYLKSLYFVITFKIWYYTIHNTQYTTIQPILQSYLSQLWMLTILTQVYMYTLQMSAVFLIPSAIIGTQSVTCKTTLKFRRFYKVICLNLCMLTIVAQVFTLRMSAVFSFRLQY